MSRIKFNDTPVEEEVWGLEEAEKFLVLSATLVVVKRHRRSGDVTIVSPTSFTKAQPAQFELVSRDLCIWEKKERGVRSMVVGGSSPSKDRGVRSMTTALWTLLTSGKSKNFCDFTVLIDSKGVLQQPKKSGILNCFSAKQQSLICCWYTDPHDTYSTSFNSCKSQFSAFCTDENEFEEKFGKAVRFLGSRKNLYMTRVGRMRIFVEHADSLYLFDW